MGPNERASNALRAMKAMDISEQRVRPVLKNLLKLYDKNWELIEDEHYRVLLDAIFDQEKEEEKTNMEAPSQDESSAPPLKRMRLRSQAEKGSPSGEKSLRRPKVEGEASLADSLRTVERDGNPSDMHVRDEQETPASPLTLSRLDSEEPSQLYLRDREHDPVSFHSHSKGKGKEPIFSPEICRREESSLYQLHSKDSTAECHSPLAHISVAEMAPSSPQLTYRDKGSLPARSSFGTCFKEPKVEPGIILLPKEKLPDPRQTDGLRGLIKPKSEPINDFPPFEVPIAIMHPPNPNITINDDVLHKDGFSTMNGTTGQVNGSAGSSELANISDSSTSFEIASSPLGEVKISLNCNQADSSMPSLDAVLKAVEDKCLSAYRILEPNFSMRKLMQEMCQSFLDLSNKSTDPKGDSFVHLASDFNFLKKSSLQNAFGANGGQQGNMWLPASLRNGALSSLSSAEVVLPETRDVLLLNGPDCHHNQISNGSSNGIRDMEANDPDSSNSRSLVVVPQQGSSIDDVKPFHDVNDISKGEERVRISVINEVSSDQYPPSFYYIPRNIVYQNAYLNFSLARIGDEDCCSNCFGDCLSSSIPCACARATGGEFAYTLEGLVKEKFLDLCLSMNRDPQQDRHYYCKNCPLERSKEGLFDPCKGHLVRTFIKECWSKCGCNKQCGNRVVQRGISCNLQVFLTSEGKGWGVRTLEDLPRGTFVCEYVGEVLTNTELHERNTRSTGNEKHTYPVLLDADWGSEGVLKDEEALCLDATYYGNVARFVNHRCFDANLVEIPVEVESPDHHYYHLAYFTARKIDALEELTWDYGIDFTDHNHPVKAFRCLCGSQGCRDMKRSHRTKSKR